MRAREATAIALLAAALGCARAPPPTVDAGFRVVLDALPATLLSAWEAPQDAVLYAVGGTATRALVLRHDADGWWEMDPGTAHALWWVHGSSASDVTAVGDDGVITHFDGTQWTVEREGGGFTLYGVWGEHREDLVAVGGVLSGSQPRAVLLTRRAGWAEASTAALPPGQPLFKVWGTSADALVVVGERGLLARGSPEHLAVEATPATERLTTVAGGGGALYAVGGLREPVLLRFDGARWRSLSPPGSPQLLNGVAVDDTGAALVVGLDGYLAEGKGDAFARLPSPTTRGLHGAAATRTGFVAVGGELLGAFGHGVLLARGALEAGTPRPWPAVGRRFDAGVDAGRDAGPADASVADGGEDAGPAPDGGGLGPGSSCDGQLDACAQGLTCWLVFGPFRSYCSATCVDASGCGAYGPGACCHVPGPQVTVPVCLPAAAGVCDGGF